VLADLLERPLPGPLGDIARGAIAGCRSVQVRTSQRACGQHETRFHQHNAVGRSASGRSPQHGRRSFVRQGPLHDSPGTRPGRRVVSINSPSFPSTSAEPRTTNPSNPSDAACLWNPTTGRPQRVEFPAEAGAQSGHITCFRSQRGAAAVWRTRDDRRRPPRNGAPCDATARCCPLGRIRRTCRGQRRAVAGRRPPIGAPFRPVRQEVRAGLVEGSLLTPLLRSAPHVRVNEDPTGEGEP
jgi:hypothetical protein